MGRRAKTTLTLQVKFEVPIGATVNDAAQYIRDAIASYKGGLNTDDPMFYLDRDSVKVSLLKREINYA